MYARGQYPPTNAVPGSSAGAGTRGYAEGNIIYYDPANAEEDEDDDEDDDEDSDEEMSVKEEEIDDDDFYEDQDGEGIAGHSQGLHPAITPTGAHPSNNGGASGSSFLPASQGSSQYAQRSRPGGDPRSSR